MTTVMDEYRRSVRLYRPHARCRVMRDHPRVGDRSYQIMDGEEAIGDPECSPTIAWREAYALLASMPTARHLAMAGIQ